MKNPETKNKLDEAVAKARNDSDLREQSYRAQALKLYPWICGKCKREFTYTNLQELTVHHRDHNHDNNPSDGSNWELLCVYCHDNEHSRYLDNDPSNVTLQGKEEKSATHNPFENLKDLLKK